MLVRLIRSGATPLPYPLDIGLRRTHFAQLGVDSGRRVQRVDQLGHLVAGSLRGRSLPSTVLRRRGPHARRSRPRVRFGW